MLISERISKVAQDADAETDTKSKEAEIVPLHSGESSRKTGADKTSESVEPTSDDNTPPSSEIKESQSEEEKQG